jgi:ribosomal protein S18 acetylase RimI-like enzyme
MEIVRLTQASRQELTELNTVLKQMRSDPESHEPLSMDHLDKVLSNPQTVVLVIRDNKKIIGTGTLIWNSILTDKFAFLEDVVVDEAYRGQGLGENLTRELIEVGRSVGVRTIALTSRPTRIAANRLYPKLGFNIKQTNYYELDL